MTRLAKEMNKKADRIFNGLEMGSMLGEIPHEYIEKQIEEAHSYLDIVAKSRGYSDWMEFSFVSNERTPDEVKYGWC